MQGARAPAASPRLRCGRFLLPLTRPLIMGVVNITPDSFSDGGRFLDPAAAAEHASRLAEEGADILDLGAESTRPGAAPVSAEAEAARVLPVLDAVRGLPLPISVDTRKPETMRAALSHGASMINDIDALQAPGALDAVRDSDCGLCLMHKQGDPQTMQVAPAYTDVMREVKEFLAQRVAACSAAGIDRERLAVDPGFGFGKTAAHNLELLRRLGELAQLGMPVLAGLSRKTTLGEITGRAPGDRLAASVAAALLAVQRGAAIVRVHDVAATRDALLVLSALQEAER
ncbi:MAG TPA: dihydropteroate synthase [Burkholderiales bacterium]|nr:dihydropteroate synthase [Burkholderiales bacterium]